MKHWFHPIVASNPITVTAPAASVPTIFGSWLPRYLMRSLGWVLWDPDPGVLLKLGRIRKVGQTQRHLQAS